MLRVWTTNIVEVPRAVSDHRLTLQVLNISSGGKIVKRDASSVTKIGGMGAGGRYQQSGGVRHGSIEEMNIN